MRGMAFFRKKEMPYCLGGGMVSVVGNTNHVWAKVVFIILWAGGSEMFHGSIHYRVGVDGEI